MLLAVLEDDAYANLVLPGLLRSRGIAGRDAPFTTELSYGTLRGQGLLDAVIADCSSRPLAHIDGRVLIILRLGAHQLLSMRVPDHAAVSESVALARARVGVGPAQFVNAVLRRVQTRELPEWRERLVEPLAGTEHEVERLALYHSHPAWIVRALGDALAAHGRDRGELSDLLAADNRPAGVSLVIRPGLSDVEELERAGALPGRWARTAAGLESGDPHDVSAVRSARAGVQDEGSQLAALSLGLGADPDVSPAADADGWIDLCAGPGGKAALLAGLAAERGRDFTALEIADHRAELVRSALAGFAALPAHRATDGEAAPTRTVLAADARDFAREHPDAYGRVMADVPCSGLGALRRRPESRWRRTPQDVGALGKIQRDLFDSAVTTCAPGGVIAYITCSPHPAETVLVVQAGLRRHPGLTLLDARPAMRAGLRDDLRSEPDLGPNHTVQLWPHVHGTDAMFIALLRAP